MGNAGMITMVKQGETVVWIQPECTGSSWKHCFTEYRFDHPIPTELALEGSGTAETMLWIEFSNRLDEVVTRFNRGMRAFLVAYAFYILCIVAIFMSKSSPLVFAFMALIGGYYLGYSFVIQNNLKQDKKIHNICKDFRPRFASRFNVRVFYRSMNTGMCKPLKAPMARALIFVPIRENDDGDGVTVASLESNDDEDQNFSREEQQHPARSPEGLELSVVDMV
jgi:hypothetical protein